MVHLSYQNYEKNPDKSFECAEALTRVGENLVAPFCSASILINKIGNRISELSLEDTLNLIKNHDLVADIEHAKQLLEESQLHTKQTLKFIEIGAFSNLGNLCIEKLKEVEKTKNKIGSLLVSSAFKYITSNPELSLEISEILKDKFDDKLMSNFCVASIYFNRFLEKKESQTLNVDSKEIRTLLLDARDYFESSLEAFNELKLEKIKLVNFSELDTTINEKLKIIKSILDDMRPKRRGESASPTTSASKTAPILSSQSNQQTQ